MSKISAGILLFRQRAANLQVLLAHPGGPFYRNKDNGCWSIPKGEVEEGEDLLCAARREFAEEIGIVLSGPFIALTPVRQKSGKMVHAWACEGDFEPRLLKSNLFSIEWPPGSGKMAEFPEVDRVDWFAMSTARTKTNAQQALLLDELSSLVRV